MRALVLEGEVPLPESQPEPPRETLGRMTPERWRREHHHARGTRILLDGEPLDADTVIAADDREGWVELLVKDAAGQYQKHVSGTVAFSLPQLPPPAVASWGYATTGQALAGGGGSTLSVIPGYWASTSVVSDPDYGLAMEVVLEPVPTEAEAVAVGQQLASAMAGMEAAAVQAGQAFQALGAAIADHAAADHAVQACTTCGTPTASRKRWLDGPLSWPKCRTCWQAEQAGTQEGLWEHVDHDPPAVPGTAPPAVPAAPGGTPSQAEPGSCLRCLRATHGLLELLWSPWGGTRPCCDDCWRTSLWLRLLYRRVWP